MFKMHSQDCKTIMDCWRDCLLLAILWTFRMGPKGTQVHNQVTQIWWLDCQAIWSRRTEEREKTL